MLIATNLRKSFGLRVAVDGVSLRVAAGEVAGIDLDVGPAARAGSVPRRATRS